MDDIFPMRELAPDFPSLVRKIRAHLTLSQEDLARELRVSFSTINRWENKKTRPIKLARQQFDAFCTKMVRHKRIPANLLYKQ